MKSNFKESLSKIDIPAGRKDAILEGILSAANSIRRGKRKENNTMKNIWKFALAGAGLAVCMALAVIAVLAITSQPEAPQNTVAIAENPMVSEAQPLIDTFELSVKNAGSPQYIAMAALKNGNKIETQYTLPDDFFILGKNGALESYSGIDFKVENANASKVIFESKNYDLDYEDSRNFVTEDKTPTWSEYDFTIDLKDLGGNREFSREEVIAALKNILTPNNQKYKLVLRQFVDRLYTFEGNEVTDSGGNYDKFLEEKMSEPIDFDRYLAEYKVGNNKDKGFDREYLVIRLVNPDNQPIPRVTGKKVETRPGEVVVWMIDGKDLLGKQKSGIDFTAITDEIKVTVIYVDGSQQKQVWVIEFNEDGKAILFCADVSGAAA